MYTQSNSSVGFSGSTTFKRNSTMTVRMVKLFCDLQWYNTTFTKNSARFHGGGIHLNSSDTKFSACTTFMRNSV